MNEWWPWVLKVIWRWLASEGQDSSDSHCLVASLLHWWVPAALTGACCCIFTTLQQCRWKTFMVQQTFVWWALYILYKFVKSPTRHLGEAVGNVPTCPSTLLQMVRDHSMYAPSQWEMALHCNAISHWLGAYSEWSLMVGHTFKPDQNGCV